MSTNDMKPRAATFTLNPDQLEWVDREAQRLGAEVGVAVSRSAVVRRALDEARRRQG